jgi:uncharacterized protein (TIGR02301 family)
MRRLAWIGVAAALAAAPAQGQDGGTGHRRAVLELAGVLGRSHALRQACRGEADQYWRGWMEKMLATEAAGEAFDRRLRSNFNAGYAAAQAQFPACTGEAQAEADRLASRGRALAAAAGD